MTLVVSLLSLFRCYASCHIIVLSHCVEWGFVILDHRYGVNSISFSSIPLSTTTRKTGSRHLVAQLSWQSAPHPLFSITTFSVSSFKSSISCCISILFGSFANNILLHHVDLRVLKIQGWIDTTLFAILRLWAAWLLGPKAVLPAFSACFSTPEHS